MTQLRARQPDLELRWLGGHRGLEASIVPGAGIALQRLWLRSLRTVDASPNIILDPLRLVASVPQALVGLLRWRPDVVYTTGGYVAIPVLAAAALLGIPSLIWEGNASPGRSVRLSARTATARTVSFAVTRDRLPPPTFVIGTPIRDLGGLDKAAARERWAPRRRTGAARLRRLPVGAGGSTRPSPRPSPAWSSVAAWSMSPVRPASLRRRRCAPGCLLGAPSATAPTSSCTTRWRRRSIAADLLVGRAGSSTLAEAAAAGLP